MSQLVLTSGKVVLNTSCGDYILSPSLVLTGTVLTADVLYLSASLVIIARQLTPIVTSGFS